MSSLSSPPYTATWWLLSTLHSLNWLQDTTKLSRSLLSKLEERFKFHTMHAQHEFTIVSFFTLDFDGKFILSSAHGLTLNCTSTEIQNNELLINWMSLFLFPSKTCSISNTSQLSILDLQLLRYFYYISQFYIALSMHLLPHCKLVLLKLLLNFLSSALEDGATPCMQDLHTKCFSRIFIFGNIFSKYLIYCLLNFPWERS